MDFADLKQELADRGFSYLPAPRLGRYINLGRAELDESDLWPYREGSATGVTPLEIDDLGAIETVLDTITAQPLHPRDMGALTETYGDLTRTGTSRFYYIDWVTGSPVVHTFPVSPDSVSVRFWTVPPDLAEDDDTPVAPTRFHNLIVDIAVRMAYRDSDNHEAATQLDVQIQRDLMNMRRILGLQQFDSPQDYIRTTGHW